MDLENKFQVKNWPFIPQTHRTYENITNYCPEPQSNGKYIFETLRSEKQPTFCQDDCCCMDLTTLGNFSLELGTWNSKRERIECMHHDCKNSQGKFGRQKVLGVDVKETLCWGIDSYTKKNLFYLLPENLNDEAKYKFIQISLMKAANLLENDGWEMQKVCEFILNYSVSKKSKGIIEDNSKYIFSNLDRKFAKLILKSVKLKVDLEAFRIHPKGMGVICANRNGIIQNDLIIKYIGEIYRPYRWFERQDFVKKYMKDNNQQDVLPDFYNIQLELHKNETKGIDILYVDPMQKGNYSSRLSHSCDPNCGTVATISEQTYNISMFAMKNIEYGEELAFDYSAVTESKNEHRQSTCLCGTQRCRGRYIEFNNNNQKEYNYILERVHCFLKRNSDLIRSGSEPITDEDLMLLEKYNIRQNVKSGCEPWLLKWISIVLQSVDTERDLFFSDQLITNPYLQQNDKDILSYQKAISLKDQQLFEQEESQTNKKQVSSLSSIPLESKCSEKDLVIQLEESVGEKLETLEKDGIQQQDHNQSPENQTQLSVQGGKRAKVQAQKPRFSAYEIQEQKQLQQLMAKSKEEIENLIVEKQLEKQKNIEYLKYLAQQKSENRIQNILISLDKVKFYLNNVKDTHPPLSYLSPEEILINLYGISYSQKKGKVQIENIQNFPIIEELKDLLDRNANYKECKYAIKFIELFHPYMEEFASYSTKKALLAWRLFCLNIHSQFESISNPKFHSGALLLMLYFYAFTHTYFTPHEYSQLNSEKMIITEAEMLNLELLDEDKKSGQKVGKKKNYEDQRSYSSQFIWGQLTVWFKQTVASPQATLSQDRRGTLSYPQLNQSFQTDILTYPFQEKNDKSGRKTFLQHLKEKPKDMWPPDQAKWSFKNSLKNYGTLVFEGVHNQVKVPNLIERVVSLVDEPFEKKLALFIEIEGKLGENEEIDIRKMQESCFDIIRKKCDDQDFKETEKSTEDLKRGFAISTRHKAASQRTNSRNKVYVNKAEKKEKKGKTKDGKKKRKVSSDEDSEEDQFSSNEELDYDDEGSEQERDIEVEEIYVEEVSTFCKKRRYNEYVLNDEGESSKIDHFSQKQLYDIVKNPETLRKYLTIELDSSLIKDVIPRLISNQQFFQQGQQQCFLSTNHRKINQKFAKIDEKLIKRNTDVFFDEDEADQEVYFQEE